MICVQIIKMILFLHPGISKYHPGQKKKNYNTKISFVALNKTVFTDLERFLTTKHVFPNPEINVITRTNRP